ncbi:MAG: radical SAM family heme chaperone HemW [Elusimicrobia bacterium]|nr:radical SAM family heme chaperone HemW [Elusimicrobiota bacterium]
MSFFSIYVHIPFCRRKCNYCAFYSVTQTDLINEYIRSLEKEIELQSKTINKNIKKYKTIYFGGGTPSVIDIKSLEKIFRKLANIKGFNSLDEVTFEANPDSIDDDKIKLLRDFNITRVSLGLESSLDKYLKFLGRLSSYDDFLKKYDAVKKYFDVNIDLIYGIPGQSEKELVSDIKNAVDLKPDHISVYGLEIHKNTPFYGRVKTDDDEMSNFYFLLCDFLVSNGYLHYEISNFSLLGKESKHNLNYWNWGDYIGLGASASSHIRDMRYKNISDVRTYITALNNGKIELEYSEKLDKKDINNEILMLSLRKVSGLDKKSPTYLIFKDKILSMISKGYMEEYKDSVRIKKEYFFVSNSIISDIMQ